MPIFKEGADLADHDTLLSLVKEMGLDDEAAAKVLADPQAFKQEVQAQMSEARDWRQRCSFLCYQPKIWH